MDAYIKRQAFLQRGQAVQVINAYAEAMAPRDKRGAQQAQQAPSRAAEPKRKPQLMSMDDFISKVM